MQRKINRFVGLKPDIKKHVCVSELRTYTEVLQKAQILVRENELTSNANSREKSHSPPQKKPWNKNFQELKKEQEAPKKNQKTQGRVYALTRQEVEASPSVVSGIVPVSGHIAFVLFNSGSTHSFMSAILLEDLIVHLKYWSLSYVLLPLQGNLYVLKSCRVQIEDKVLKADLIILDIRDFDIIFGMDWLSAYLLMSRVLRRRLCLILWVSMNLVLLVPTYVHFSR
ncbi:hypothetical protein JRO89_XS04G0099700 [Xanthoceras sorbifolium]|uniref:Reverse transcriptase domain-containing protein n=1 Tax=Xanthoceras sorbifolium TaxID=99658 RepID=A0ABQ8I4P6_9ROSI|nr:hypothetical protein JRO89_XS04G0099700 [Xanthoceras sorbifolium]